MLRAKTVNNNPYDSVLTCSEIIKKQERSFSGLTNCVHADNRQKLLRPLNVALSKSETVDTDSKVGTS